MELRHLRYFVAVAEELHFRHAAERLHVAQPAVSEQVRKLEAELGVRLLDRSQRSVSLTVAGTALLEEARRVLRQADVAQQAARNAREREIGRIRVGYLADFQPSALPVALSQYASAAPGIELVLQVGQPARLAGDVRQGLLDVAVVCLPAPVAGLRVTSLGLEAATVAVPEGLEEDLEAAVRPAQVADIPLILLPRALNPAFYDGVISTWRDAGVAARPIEATEPRVEHALLAVAAGTGIAVLPESAAGRYSVPGVRFMPLVPTPMCEVAAITRDEASAPVAALLRLARRAARPGGGDRVRRLTAASA